MSDMPDVIDVCNSITATSAWQPFGSKWWEGDAYEYHQRTKYLRAEPVEALLKRSCDSIEMLLSILMENGISNIKYDLTGIFANNTSIAIKEFLGETK